MFYLILANAFLFIAISLLHFYWAMGGKWAATAVLPSSPEGQLSFQPGVIATLIVAIGLLFFAALTLANAGFASSFIPAIYAKYGVLAIGCIFIIRAVGDFKYVGFFKRIKGTIFAENDTKIYSPLSFVMGLISLAIYFF